MSLITTNTKKMPQKVLSLAKELGVHSTCVDLDFKGACTQCINLFNEAFDAFYGEADNADDALMMILSDILDDRVNETQ